MIKKSAKSHISLYKVIFFAWREIIFTTNVLTRIII